MTTILPRSFSVTTKLFLVAVLLAGVTYFAPATVSAQTSVPNESFALNGLKTDFVWAKDDLSAEVLKQRTIFRDQLEQYRQQEKNFLIAQDQYRKHETLDSIEQAVQATKRMLLSRDQLLHTYLTLLQLRLMSAEGVELSLKDKEIQKLESLREQLKVHHAAASGQLDRPAVNKSSDDFLTIGQEAQMTASQTLGLLAVSKLQEINDKSRVLFPDIATEVTVTTEDQVISPQTTRSLKETGRAMTQNDAAMLAVWEKVGQRINDNSELSGQTDFSQELEVAYTGLTKTLGYFLELLKLFRTTGAAAAS
jgi:uncharacterized membrane protein